MLREIQALSADRPVEVILILLSGYLQIASRRATGTEQGLAYVNASHAVDELCSVLADEFEVPDTAPESLYHRNINRLWNKMTSK